jgi:hypothetical protein
VVNLKNQTREELLDGLLNAKAGEITLLQNPPSERVGLFEISARISEIRHEIISRMRPDGPPKTEKARFGELKKGDEYLTPAGLKERVIMNPENGVHGALRIDGEHKDEVHYPAQSFEVQKIIK